MQARRKRRKLHPLPRARRVSAPRSAPGREQGSPPRPGERAEGLFPAAAAAMARGEESTGKPVAKDSDKPAKGSASFFAKKAEKKAVKPKAVKPEAKASMTATEKPAPKAKKANTPERAPAEGDSLAERSAAEGACRGLRGRCMQRCGAGG